MSLYRSKELILQELKSSDMNTRRLGSDEVRDMLEFNEISKEDANEYAQNIVLALQKKNSKNVQYWLISNLATLCEDFQGLDFDKTIVLNILKTANDEGTLGNILVILKNSRDKQYLPIIQKFKEFRNKDIQSFAIEAEIFLTENTREKDETASL